MAIRGALAGGRSCVRSPVDSSLPLARFPALPALDALGKSLATLTRASHRFSRRAEEVLQPLAPSTCDQERTSFGANGIGHGRLQVRPAEEPARPGSQYFGKSRRLCRQDSGMFGEASRGASASQPDDYNWRWTCRLLPAPAIVQAGRSTQARSPPVPRAATSGKRSMHTGALRRGLRPQEESVAK